MEMNGKNYNMSQLREKMPRYPMFQAEKVVPGSHEDKLDKDPIATTNPNLHLRHDESQVVKQGEGEVADRQYTFLGTIGTQAYSCKRKFTHDEEDTTKSETP